MAERTVEIHVTQECIDEGKRAACYDCPVALAIVEVIKLDARVVVHVTRRTATLTYRTVRWRYPLPDNVQDFIAQFDDVDVCTPPPFGFCLTLPAELLR